MATFVFAACSSVVAGSLPESQESDAGAPDAVYLPADSGDPTADAGPQTEDAGEPVHDAGTPLDAGPAEEPSTYGVIEQIAPVLGTAVALAVDNAVVCWSDYAGSPQTGVEYSLKVAPRAGGDATVLAKTGLQDGSVMESVAVYDETVYWIEGGPNERLVKAIPVKGGAPRVLARTESYYTDPLIASWDGLWFGGLSVVGTSPESDAVVFKLPFAGGTPQIVTWGQSVVHLPWSVAVARDFVVMTAGDANAYVAPRGSSRAKANWAVIGAPVTLSAATGTRAWVVTGNGKGNARIMEVLGGGSARQAYAAPAGVDIGALAANANHVFWTEGSKIRTLPLAGGPAVDLVTGETATALFATGHFLYYADGSRISRVGAP